MAPVGSYQEQDLKITWNLYLVRKKAHRWLCVVLHTGELELKIAWPMARPSTMHRNSSTQYVMATWQYDNLTKKLMLCRGRSNGDFLINSRNLLEVCTDCTVTTVPGYLVCHTYVCKELLEINRYSTTPALLLNGGLFMSPPKLITTGKR